jgi:hypothetical protein
MGHTKKKTQSNAIGKRPETQTKSWAEAYEEDEEDEDWWSQWVVDDLFAEGEGEGEDDEMR